VILPTRRLAGWVASLGVLTAVAILLPELRLVALLGDAVLAVAAVLDALACPGLRSIHIRRQRPDRLPRGREALFHYEIEHRGGRQPIAGSILDTWPLSFEELETPPRFAVAPGEHVTLPARALPSMRGEHTLGPVFVKLESMLRLWERRGKVDLPEAVHVDPTPVGVVDGIRRVRALLRQQGARLVRVKGRATEFEQLRDYVMGDDIRSVDWKATARRAKVTVRDYRTERNREVSIVLDVGRKSATRFQGASKLDASLDALLGLSRVALEAGDRVGWIAFAAKPVLEVAARRGIAQYAQIFDATRWLAPDRAESSLLAALRHHRATHRKRAFVLLVTDLPDPVSAKRLIPALAALARRHELLFAAVDDPERRALEEMPIRTVEDAYLVAGARRIRRERLEVLADLRRYGVRSMDVTPDGLSGPVIDAYLAAAAEEAF